MPFGDRSLDLVVATHPDADHVGGLPAVLENYNVSMILENGAESKTKIYEALEDEITTKNVKKEIAKRGMKIMFDDEKNIYFDILYPDRDVSNLDSNDGSIVGKLVYGNESFMLTGDATNYVENIISWNEKPEILHSNVLKLGHHGSRTSNSVLWLEEVNPETAIVSAGLNNRYNHPHQEVLDRLAKLKIPFLSTAKEGTIIFKTDGITLLSQPF
jgi:competence protein ComEC